MLGKIVARLHALLLSCASIAAADVMPIPGTQPVKPVFDKSDLVCICTAESSDREVLGGLQDSTGRPVARITTTTTFAIAVVFKGEGSPGQQLAIHEVHDSPLPPPPAGSFKKGQPFLLFLVRASPATYETADKFLGISPFSGIPTGPTAGGFSGLETTLAQIVVQPDRHDKLRALRLLQGFDAVSRQTEALMQKLANSDDSEIALTAWAILLKSKNPDVVAGMSAYLSAHPEASEPTFALIGVEEGLSAIRSDRTLESLEQLAGSKYFEIRTGALYALRGIKDPRSVPTLIQRLDDQRRELRYLAVITLAETLKKYDGDFAPSMFLFDKRPDYYIALWKQWWADEGSRMYPSESPAK